MKTHVDRGKPYTLAVTLDSRKPVLMMPPPIPAVVQLEFARDASAALPPSQA